MRIAPHACSYGPAHISSRRACLLVFLLMTVAVLASACAHEPSNTRQPPSTNEQIAGAATTTQLVVPMTARDGPEGTFIYTVQTGDTLFSIGRRFGTSAAAIISLNPIADPNNIAVGQKLVVPLAPATPVATPTPMPRGPSILVQNGPRTSQSVALTLDMGGRVDDAVAIMNWLIANQVHATIFITGAIVENVNTDAGRQVLSRVAAHPDLFALGNHSYSHPDFTMLSGASIRSELATTQAAIAEEQQLDPRPLFRPPFGAVNSHVLEVAGLAGYSQTINWDVDTIDWRPESEGGPTAAQIVAKVLNNARGGSIVLMHLGGYNTHTALPQMVAGLRALGFNLVTVPELLEIP